VDAFLTRLSFLALLFQVALWGTSLIRFFIERDVKVSAATDGARAQTMKAIGFIATFALYLVILLWGLDNFGVNITTLIAGLGVGGIAIALAVQNILGDLFASLTIVLDKPFVYGDFITVGEFKGTIENVGLKTTRVRSLTGEQLIFPNSDLLQSRIRNFKRMQERRAAFVFNVDNNTPVEELKRLLQELRRIVENQKAIRFERANFTQFTATNALEFEVIYWVLSPDYQIYANVQEAINLEILAYLQSQKIRFPFAPAPSPVKS
jgi:small-conductance mechanosensitive channel